MSSQQQWDRLPEDLLHLIIQRLDLLSRIRCSAVCKSWTSAIKLASDHECFWLLLPREPTSEHLSFFDLCEGAVFKLKLPESFRGKHCWVETSSDGRWIVVKTGYSLLEISLLDPFSGFEIKLPCFRKKRDSGIYIDSRNIKLQLFSLDGSQSIVAALFDNKTLGFCKLGGQDWIFHHANNYRGWDDFCFSNGIFYVLDEYKVAVQTAVQTHYMNLSGNEIILKFIPSSHSCWIQSMDSQSSNLVEYNGDLFRVHTYKTGRTFLMSKVQPSHDAITRVDELRSWKDQTLLIARGIAATIPATNFKKIQENCTSFLEEYCGHDSGRRQNEISLKCGLYNDGDYRIYTSLRIINSNLSGFLPIIKIGRF